jgi:TRAP-type transport system periplasmic protein
LEPIPSVVEANLSADLVEPAPARLRRAIVEVAKMIDYGSARYRSIGSASPRASRRTFAIGSAAALSSIGVVKAPAKAAQFEFKCGSHEPRDHPSSIRLKQMFDTVEQESAGRIHVQFFPDSQLGGDATMFTQLRLGALHFLFMNAGVLASVVPPADISFLGFAYKDADEGFRVLNGPLGDYIRAEAAAKGIHGFRTMWDDGVSHVGSGTHPIRVPEDLAGFKIRTPSSRITVDLFRALGASPTPLDPAEVYTALQTKLVDGETLTLVMLETSRWYEVQKYVSLTNHAWSGLWMLANGDTWKSLPPDLQEIMERNNTKSAMLEHRDNKIATASVADKLTRQGMIMNKVDPAPFRVRLRPYYDTWASAFGPTEWGLLESGIRHKLT